MSATSTVAAISFAIIVTALLQGVHSAPVDTVAADPAMQAKQELAGGLSVLHYLMLLQEYHLTDTIVRFENDPFRSMSVMLQSYVSLISFIRQQINETDFINSEHLRLMEVVITRLNSDICILISANSSVQNSSSAATTSGGSPANTTGTDTADCTGAFTHLTGHSEEIFTSPVDLMLFTSAIILRPYISDTEGHVIVDGARDDQWPGDNINDEKLRSLLCTILDRDC